MCGLSLAWVTSENSTKLLESDSSWLTVAGPYLLCYCLPSPVLTAPVHDSTPTLWCPVANSLVRVPRQLLSFASPSHFRIRRDFRSKNPLSGFAPKQTKESSALAAHPHSATYYPFLPLSFIYIFHFFFFFCFCGRNFPPSSTLCTRNDPTLTSRF